MSGSYLAAAADDSAVVALSGSHLTIVVVVAAVALIALAVAGGLVREVLSAGQGTERMQNIARLIRGTEGKIGQKSAEPAAS